jgi:hypothetical protein
MPNRFVLLLTIAFLLLLFLVFVLKVPFGL